MSEGASINKGMRWPYRHREGEFALLRVWESVCRGTMIGGKTQLDPQLRDKPWTLFH